MAFKKGQSGNPNGRKAGAPNKITSDIRALFQLLLEKKMVKIDHWIERTAKHHPGDAVRLVLALAEFCVPRLQRLTIDLKQIPLEEIAAELDRREAELDEGAHGTNGSGGLVQ